MSYLYIFLQFFYVIWLNYMVCIFFHNICGTDDYAYHHIFKKYIFAEIKLNRTDIHQKHCSWLKVMTQLFWYLYSF